MKSKIGFFFWRLLMWPVTVWKSDENKIKFYLNYLFSSPYNSASAYYFSKVITNVFGSNLYKESNNCFGMQSKFSKYNNGEVPSQTNPLVKYSKYKNHALSCFDFYVFCSNNSHVSMALSKAPVVQPVPNKIGIISYTAFDGYVRHGFAPVLAFVQFNFSPANIMAGAICNQAQTDVTQNITTGGEIDQYGWDLMLRRSAPFLWLIFILVIVFVWIKLRRAFKAKPKLQ